MITILCLHTLFFKENKMSILIENKKVKKSTEKFENIIVKDISNNICFVFLNGNNRRFVIINIIYVI